MYCFECKKFWEKTIESLNPQARAWITGTNNFKIDTLKTHEQSKYHEEAHRVASSKQKDLSSSHAAIAPRKLNEANLMKVSVRFRNAHAVSKLDKSFKDYVWLCKLDKAKGLDIGTIYDNDKAGRVFTKYIAQAETTKTVSLLENAKFYSLTIDGATDSGVTEQESLYIHTCVEGERKQRFLQFLNPKSTSSQDIFDSVVACLSEYHIDTKKIIGITTDGASNMMVYVLLLRIFQLI